jgi:Winged helix DNA-binding domain
VAPAYLRTYGPATIERFDAWLTRSTSRKGMLRSWFAALGDDLVTADVEGTSAYLLAEDIDELTGTAPTAAVRLLPAFDQYVLGPGTAATEILDRDRRTEVSRAAGWISPVVVAAGRVPGCGTATGGRSTSGCSTTPMAAMAMAARRPARSTPPSSGCATWCPRSIRDDEGGCPRGATAHLASVPSAG